MSKEKSAFNRFKSFWEYGIKLTDYDKKLSIFLKNYSVNQIFASYKHNKSVLKTQEKKEFEEMIRQLMEDKKQLGQDGHYTLEEYIEFLNDMFSKVDEEDRHGDVSLNTSFSFKLVGDLIDVLAVWAEIPEEWLKKKKYCKFKAVDIHKSLVQGIQPKRGGPKEDEDDHILKDLSDIVIKDNLIDQGSLNDTLHADNNDKINKNYLHLINKAEDESVYTNKQYNISPTNQYINNEPLIDINTPAQTVYLRNDTNKYENVKLEKLEKKYKDDNNGYTSSNQFSVDKKLTPKINQIPQDLDDFNNDMVNKKIEDSTTNQKIYAKDAFIPSDYKIDPKIHKKISFSLPVKYKSIDYFRLTEIIYKLIENGMIEIKSDKVDKALVQLELALYYLRNVEM